MIHTEPKSVSSKREIPIPECFAELLQKYKENTPYFVLSETEKLIEPRTMQYRFVKILKNRNLLSIHFHALCHMLATTCIKLGFDLKALSKILGHSDVKIDS